MKRVPARVPAAEFRHHVSGGQPPGSTADESIPHPDPETWRDDPADADGEA